MITGAHNLPNCYVIHCLGPVYGMDEPAEELLAACYCNALSLAEEHGIGSIAFPAIPNRRLRLSAGGGNRGGPDHYP